MSLHTALQEQNKCRHVAGFEQVLIHLGMVALKLGLSLGALVALCCPPAAVGPDTNPASLRLELLVLGMPPSSA